MSDPQVHETPPAAPEECKGPWYAVEVKDIIKAITSQVPGVAIFFTLVGALAVWFITIQLVVPLRDAQIKSMSDVSAANRDNAKAVADSSEALRSMTKATEQISKNGEKLGETQSAQNDILKTILACDKDFKDDHTDARKALERIEIRLESRGVNIKANP